jgi:hypothetical protein
LLLLVSSGGWQFAWADDAMPPTAPPIQRNDGAEPQGMDASPAGNDVERTVVRAKPHNEPLVGAVTRADAFKSGVDYMAHVPPGMRAGVNQTVMPEVFRAWIEKSDPEILSVVLNPQQVLVVKGQWDDSARTLDKFRIPYNRIGARSMRDIPLDRVKVLIVDCSGYLPRESFQRIRDWVAAGGYLLTTDWALDNTLQKTFPGYVEWNHKINREGLYEAEAVDPDAILFRNAVPVANWRTEMECHLLTVLKPDAVRVLVRSRALAREDGQGILAVTFPFGRGHVLHLVGHFDNNPMSFHFGNSLPDPAPVIGISLRQAIAANFVVAGLTGRHIPNALR